MQNSEKGGAAEDGGVQGATPTGPISVVWWRGYKHGTPTGRVEVIGIADQVYTFFLPTTDC